MVQWTVAVEKPCGTIGTENKYCMPMSECEPQSLIDLRVSADCENPSHSCCKKKAAVMKHHIIEKTLTECDSQKGYCVRSDMCSVRTYRLRSNRCPTLEEVCCPKQSVDGLPTTTAAPTTTTATSPTASPTKVQTKTTFRTTTTVPTSTTAATTTVAPKNSTTTKDSANDSKADPAAQDGSSKTGPTDSSPIGTEATGNLETTDSNLGSIGSKTGVKPTFISRPHLPSKNESETTDGYDTSRLSEDLGVTESVPKIRSTTPKSESTVTTQTAGSTTAPEINDFIPNLKPEFKNGSFNFRKCGQRNRYGVVESIVQGENYADYGEYPWMAAFFEVNRDNNEMRYCCNGALIEPFIVITTANCFSNCGSNPANMVVRLGEWIMNSTIEPIPHEDFQVDQMVKHPDFHPSSLINNVALVALKSDVEYKPTIQPICLPSNEEQLLSTQPFVATGWGATVEQTMVGVKTHSDVLKRLDLHYEPFTKCVKHIEDRKFIFHDSFACTTTQNEERPCKGDAGAPVFLERRSGHEEHYLYGLVSWGWGCHQKQRKETVVTVVEKFQKWIDKTINELQQS